MVAQQYGQKPFLDDRIMPAGSHRTPCHGACWARKRPGSVPSSLVDPIPWSSARLSRLLYTRRSRTLGLVFVADLCGHHVCQRKINNDRRYSVQPAWLLLSYESLVAIDGLDTVYFEGLRGCRRRRRRSNKLFTSCP